MADFTSRAGKRRKEKAHHPLEPVADKLYSHLRTSAHHILVLWLLHPPNTLLPAQYGSVQLLSCAEHSGCVAGRTRSQVSGGKLLSPWDTLWRLEFSETRLMYLDSLDGNSILSGIHTTKFSHPCTHGKGTYYKTNCIKSWTCARILLHPFSLRQLHLANTHILWRCTRRKQAMS